MNTCRADPRRKYEHELAQLLGLPHWSCIYNPEIYWQRLTDAQRDTLAHYGRGL